MDRLGLELKLDALPDDAPGTFEGMASVTGLVDKGMDIVEAGAFTKTLGARATSIKMLWNHDPSDPIGVWDKLEEVQGGLRVKGRLALGVPRAAATYELMKMGALDGLSIGYRTVKAASDKDRGVRRLLELDLWEVSLVAFPMQEMAKVSSVKSDEIDELDLSGIERLLREAGSLSRDQAKMILHRHSALVVAREAQKAHELARTAALQRLLETMKA